MRERAGRTDIGDGQGPEIQQMYSLNMPVSAIRTKMRQEFERHRYVNQLKTVDVLLFNSHQEFQVRIHLKRRMGRGAGGKKECGYGCGRYVLMSGTGDIEFLEAAHARAEVLPSGGGAEGEVAEEFHTEFHRGMPPALLAGCTKRLANSPKGRN